MLHKPLFRTSFNLQALIMRNVQLIKRAQQRPALHGGLPLHRNMLPLTIDGDFEIVVCDLVERSFL